MTTTNETVYGLWDTRAGENGTLSTPGSSTGNYYSTEKPMCAFDRDNTTRYTSYGACSSTVFALTCGEDTGLYLTLQHGPTLLQAFRFLTSSTNLPKRDPITVTIEGSNHPSTILRSTSAWTLIYNGSSGLINNSARSAYGTTQQISNNAIAYASYRILITSIRGNATSVNYSEIELLG